MTHAYDGVLTGRTVAVTGADGPDRSLVRALEEAGARVVSWPTIVIDPPADADPLLRAAESLDSFDWIAFTSSRAVDAIVGRAPAAPTTARIAAVGETTAAALAAAGWSPVVVGEQGAQALVEVWSADHDLSRARVLFPAGSLAATTLEDALASLGATTHRVAAYRTRLVPPDPERVLADLATGIDTITLASPSAVRSLADALAGDWPDSVAGCAIAAIGPTTAAALIDAGIEPDRIRIAEPPGIHGLVATAANPKETVS